MRMTESPTPITFVSIGKESPDHVVQSHTIASRLALKEESHLDAQGTFPG